MADKNTSISDEWGSFVSIPKEFTKASRNLSDQARWLFVLLREYTNGESGKAFPSYLTITERTGWTPKTISKALKGLELAGWLSREHQFGGVTHYTLKKPSNTSHQEVAPNTSQREVQYFREGSPILPNGTPIKNETTKIEINENELVNLPKAENLLVASEISSQEIVEPSLANSPNVDLQKKPAAAPKAKRARKPHVDSGKGKTSTPTPKTQPDWVSASSSAHQVMMAALATTTNQPILNGAAQGKAIKTILNHYTAEQGIEVLHWMADPKTNWRGKVDWLAVQNFIPEYFRRKAQLLPPPNKEPNGFTTTKRDFSRVIANLPEHLR